MFDTNDIRIMRVSNGWVIDPRGYRGQENTLHAAAVAETPSALVALVREWADGALDKKEVS